MPKMATKAADNVFYKARIAAASWNDRLGSREGASEVTGIDRTRLANIELGTINPHPEEVLMLSDTYNAPELQNHFCSHLCPLGIGTISPIELEELERVTLQLISAMKSLPEVKGVLIDTEGGPASEAVVQRVQEYIDPGGTGLGEGQANIGAHFTATSATAKRVNISFSVTLAKGGDLASVRSAAQTALKAQIKSINLTTDDSETPTLRISTVGNTIYGLLGVLDYANLRFNGQTANVEAGKEEVFVLGEVTVSETNPVS